MAETPTYNRQDIARYLQHRMSPQEMHAFEKAMMDDPFLADAFEGYTAGDESLTASHLASIEQQLTGDKKQGIVVPITPSGRPWWKAAVVAAAMAAGCVITFFLLQNKQPSPLAVRKRSADTAYARAPAAYADTPAVTAAPLQQTYTPPVNGEIAAPRRPAPLRQSPALSRATAYTPAKADTTGSPSALNTATPELARATMPPAQALGKTAGETARPAMVPAPALHAFRGRVTDANGAPIALATIIDNSTHKGTVSDEQGYFMLNGPDSLIGITISTLGYASVTTVFGSSEKPSSIVLGKSDQALSEVVVGFGTTRRKAGALPDSSSVAEPVGGWKNFRQYFNQHIDSLQVSDRRYRYRNDEVVLEFLIDEGGNPVNIKVKEQPNDPVSRKAVEILSNGPRWRKKKDEKIKVAIPVGAGR